MTSTTSTEQGRHLVALFGATGSGKTSAAVAIRHRLPVEVIAADSRQLRRDLRIGTAAPTEPELTAVPHHLIAIADPDTHFTLADWLEAAHAALDVVWARGAIPLVVAGTGQYAWALLEGWDVPHVPPDPELRETLERVAEQEGASALHQRLLAVDPASAARIPYTNVRRVIRALEIVEITGAPVPPPARRRPAFTWHGVGLQWSREALHARTDARVEAMFAAGLIDETGQLIERFGRDWDALTSIGYAEALRVLDGELSEAEAIEHAKIATHRLIRMQATWFRADDDRITWVDGADTEAVIRAVEAAARAPVP